MFLLLGAGTNTTDSVAPTLQSATVDATGTTLTLVFDEAVAGFSGTSGFALESDAGAVSAAYASGDGTATVVFDASRTVGSAETLTLDYTPGAIEDLAGNALAAFAGAGVTNDSTADTTPPTVTGRAIDTAGTTLTLTFSELVTGFASGAEGFSLTCSGGAVTLAYASGDGTDTVAFDADRTIGQGETVTVTYTPGDIVDGSDNALAGFSDVSVTNGSTEVPATLSSATVQSSGTTLRVVFSAAVTGFSSGAEGFALTGLSGGATTLTYSSGNDSTTVDFTISRTVYSSETGGVLAYVAGDITRQSNGLALANFSGTGVTNSSTQVPPSVRASSTGTGADGQTVCTLPTRSSGDTLVVFLVNVNSGGGPAANTGWTRRMSQTIQVGGGSLSVYTRTSDGTDNTPFGAGVNLSYCYTAVSIKDAAAGFDAISAYNGAVAGAGSIVAATVTPTGAPAVLLSCYAMLNRTTTITVPGSQTALTQSSFTSSASHRVGHESLASASATGTRTASGDASANAWGAVNVVVK